MTVSFDVGGLLKFLLAVALIAVVVFFLRAAWRGLRRLFAPKIDGLDRDQFRSRWAEIEKASTSGEVNLKFAVMEADALLDLALKKLAMPGKTLGERLKYAAYKYPRIQQVWNAHRLRNQLAHETSSYLDPGLARKALRDFKDALTLLNVL